jgi:hypothetical protein
MENEMTTSNQQINNSNPVQELNERKKELKCLYEVLRQFCKTDVSLEQTLQKTVDLIPQGWQYPEITFARLRIGDKEYRSNGFVKSNWILTASFIINKENGGMLEVGYSEKRPDRFNGPFLEEEVFLLEAAADLIGQNIQRENLEDEKVRAQRDVKKKYEKLLSGFIPICASCKGIRDEEGVWHELEPYIQHHTEAQFSHSICPACAKKLYPHFVKK